MKAMDARMNLTTEAVTNIKALKLYSWSDKFEDEIMKKREEQISQIKMRSLWTIAMVIVS